MKNDFNYEQDKYIKADKGDLKSPLDDSKKNKEDRWDGEWGDAMDDNKNELEALLLKKKL